MNHHFVMCPHCEMPHDAAERVCPTTGGRIGADVPRSRMTPAPPVRSRTKREPSATDSLLTRTRGLPRDPLVGPTLGGRYVIRGILGEGGMGTVYDAEHLGLGRAVAMKVLRRSQVRKKVAVKRFQQEARAAGAIGHPNICEVYDMGLLDDGSPYLVMEKLVGQTLAEHLAKSGGLPFEEVVDVMIQVLSGLIAAHEKGIVHRDIKPDNVFLAERVGLPPIAKILDFGVSKMLPQFLTGGADDLDLTRTGMVIGTPFYMSPEQARGERNLDGRVDVYACGVMMYETIAGRWPFIAPNYNTLLLAIINTTPTPLRALRPETPPAIERIVQRAMMKSRADRYPSALHFVRDLQDLQRSAMDVPPPPTAAERARAPVGGGGRDRDAGAELRSRMSAVRPSDANPRSEATRLDIKRILPNTTPESDFDIPIRIIGAALPPLDSSDDLDEAPTEVFRSGSPPAPPPRRATKAEDWDTETFVRAQVASPPTNRPFNPEETMKLDTSDIETELDPHVAPPRRR